MPAVLPSSRPDDVSRPLWAPVTVRVAWELVLAGLQVRPDVLREVREHALRCLPPGVGEHEAEELTSDLVHDWLERLRKGRYRRRAADPDLALPLDPDWRRRLQEALDPLGDAVLRLHYGDGFPLEAVARSVAVEPARLEMARGGIREAARTIAIEEGLAVAGWPLARLDALIGRIARLPEPGCPGPGGLLTDEGRAHADRCPRCSRTVRLVRSGVLSPGDLFAPQGERLRPEGRIQLLALLLHPDARKHHDALSQALGGRALAVGSDAWLVAEADLEALRPRLHELALAGTPARHHLRGTLMAGSGRWVGRRILGPVPVDAVETARSRPWGEVEGVPDLPAPLPPPPRATRWWLAAGLLVALTAGVGAWVARGHEPTPSYPVQARFQPVAAGWEVRFDTDELAVVDVIARRAGRLELVERDVRAGKGRWSDGHGAYRLEVPGEEVLVVASAAGIAGLDERIAAASTSPDPLADLAQRVHAADPRASVARTPPRAPSHGP